MDARNPSARPGPFHVGGRDANPMDPGSIWRSATQVAVIGMFIILLVAGLSYARPLLLPIVLALVLGVILLPVSDWTAQRGIPHWVTAIFLVTAFFAVTSFTIVVLAEPVRDWIARAPEIVELLKERLRVFDRPLAALNTLREAIAGAEDEAGTLRVNVKASLLEPTIALLTPAIGQIMLFFGTLFFFLAAPNGVRQPIVYLCSTRDGRLRALRIFRDVERNLASTFGIIALINIGLGAATALGAWLIGLPSPLIWGLLAFGLNFIPYIGAAIVIVAMFAVGLVTFPYIGQALLAPVFFLVLTTVEGQILTPSILGRRLTVNPLAIFVSLGFWAWLWGPFGALLAVPLLIIAIVVADHLLPDEDVKLPG